MLNRITGSQVRPGIAGRWRSWFRRTKPALDIDTDPQFDSSMAIERFEIEPFDPLLRYLEENPRVTLVERIPINSSAVEALRREGVEVIVPLVTHGELVGVINLGPRLSGQGYSRDDLTLLENLATQSSAALRVAQLVREQQADLQERERLAHQLRLARDIQKTLLPKAVPDLPGWHLSTYYQPAWEVGGDFYDFIQFPDGQLGIIIGDVTDKGMPSALVMASTRSLLRASAERDRSPRAVLTSANQALVEDIPPNMFVTCLYVLLNPETGNIRFANAGHDLPYRRHDDAVTELRATGMPLGLMPGVAYDEYETVLREGETIVFYSDGLVEAHDGTGDMFGFPRLQRLLGSVRAEGPALIRILLDELTGFTGPDWRQEDDVTIVTLTRACDRNEISGDSMIDERRNDEPERELTRFLVPSAPGNEVIAIEKVVASVEHLGIPRAKLDCLKTAVGETVMNSMEHGNRFREDLPVEVSVARTHERLIVRIFDAGTEMPLDSAPAPDLDAKLAGLESPRGWGLFLIRSMVDDVRVLPDPSGQTTELMFNLEDSDVC